MTPLFAMWLAAIPAAPATAPAAFVEASPLAPFVSQDAPAPKEPKWTGSVAIGATYTSGNTDTRAVNADAKAERRGEKDRWTAKGFWNYGDQKDAATGDNTLTVRKAGASLKYDYFLSEKLYVNAIAGIETDALADMESRYNAGAGVGYQWKESDEFKWGSEAGITYIVENRKLVEDDEYAAARVANDVEWRINDKTSLSNTLEAYPSLEDGDDFFGRSDTRVKTNLTEAMFAQLQWVWDYDNTPSAGKDRNDHKLVLGVGWSF